MRRYLIISAGIIGAVCVVVALSAVFLFNTGTGRNLIKTQIEKSLGAELASDVEIKSMTGAPPGQIILNDITFSGPDGRWLGVKRVELNWRPFAYLGKRIDIEELTIDGAHLFRRPPENDEADDDDRPFLLRLDGDLPFVSISHLTLSNISTDINDEIERISGAGAMQIGGRRIKADLVLASTNDRDTINVRVDLDPDQDRLIIDATVNARAEGAIAALAGLDSDFSFTAENDGPLSAFNVAVAGTLGGYGAIRANLSNDQTASGSVNIDLSVSPDDAIAQIPELAGPLAAKMRLQNRDKGGSLIIDQLTMAAGDISGELTWLDRNGVVSQLIVDASAVLAADYRPELQDLAGSRLSVTGHLDRRGAHYGLDATLSGERAAFTIAKGVTDLRKKLSGDIALSLDPAALANAPFATGLNLTARLDADFDEALVLETVAVKSDDGASFYGSARYSFDNKSIEIIADVAATPAAISRLAPSFNATGDITADIELSGALDKLTLQASIETPELQTGENTAPPLIINVALAGLPNLPTGELNARATGKDRNGAFTAQIRASQNGRISVPVIDYHGAGFRLAGTAGYDQNTGTGAIDLTYQGDEDAAPWPGLALMGDLKIHGAMSPADYKLTAISDFLRLGEISTRSFSLDTVGPLAALRLSIDSDVIATKQTGPISQFNAAAILNFDGPLSVNLTALEGVIGGSRAHLTAPAEIRFGNGVIIDNLRLADGGNGAIAVDGAFSESRWQATAALREVNIPQADATVTLNLNLDTAAAIAANGDFMLRSLLTAGSEAALGGAFVWDGQSLRITNAEDADTIDMEIIIPARLETSPSVTLDTNGALGGYFRYDGNIAAMTPYLPPTLQTLEGALNVDFDLGGAATSPELSGRAAFSNGKFTELQSGFSLIGLHIEATARHGAQGSAIRFTGGARGAGQSKTDTVTLSGDLALGKQSLLNLSVLLNDAELSAAPISSARLNGNIDIAGSLREITATGAIIVEELDAEIIAPESTGLVDIEVIAYDGDAMPDAIIAPPSQVLKTFEISIVADDRIFIRGRGLESEWSANVTAVNTRSGPVIIGEMNLRRGALDFSGRRFDLVRGDITFDRIPENNPRLDIRAEYETPDGLTAIITVSGRADEPKVELQSTPAMPSENVMALVLFGKPAEELSAVESLQTAQALAALGGVGPFGREGITGTLRQAVGLDLLNFDIDPENGGGSLTVGKYVADGFFVSATQDAQGQAGSVRVEYEVIDNLTVETEIEQDGDQTVSANWKFDF